MRIRPAIALTVALAALAACRNTAPTPVSDAGTMQPASKPSAAGRAAAAAPAKVQARPRRGIERLSTTPSGATFTPPNGWMVEGDDEMTFLRAPQNEVVVAIIERKEREGTDAILAAWKQMNPNFSRGIKSVMNLPARGGWDAAVSVTYGPAAKGPRTASALARRKGDTWYVMAIDGAERVHIRHWNETQRLTSSLKAPGVIEESFRDKTAQVLDGARLRQLEEFVEEARRAMKIPGIAVAVVQGGKVVFEKGFGVRALGKNDPVTPRTLFRIASMTKPLTTLMMAALVDEGKFTWDTPVEQILPAFAVGDPELTTKLTMQQTVCGCSGLPRQDLETMFEHAGTTTETLFLRLKRTKPTAPAGAVFQYSSSLVAAGGYTAAHALYPSEPLGPAYEKAMAAKVFGPLGMKASTFHVAAVKHAEHASAHAYTPTVEPVAIALSDDDFVVPNWLPAGGAWSSVQDMSRYLLLELGGGKTVDGKQLVSEGSLRKRREAQVSSGDNEGYGLGLYVGEQTGIQMVWHEGGLQGCTSDMFFLPQHGVGAVVLGNLGQAGEWHRPFRRKLLELLFDGRDEAREDLAFAVKGREEAMRKSAGLIDFEPERAWLERFAGTYANPLLGKVTVRIEGKRGVFDAGEWKSAIGRRKDEDGTVKLALTSAGRFYWFDFLPQEVNGTTTLTIEHMQENHVFERLKRNR